MIVTAHTEGVEKLHARIAALTEAARTSKVVRKGISEASSLIAKAQKSIAPVRKTRPQNPDQKPGWLKRSIGSRVKIRKSESFAKSGMNVGKKGSRFAPHAAIVGSLKHKPRWTKKRMKLRPNAASRGKIRWNKAYRGVMPDNTFIRDATQSVSRVALRILEQRVKEDIATVATGGTVR